MKRLYQTLMLFVMLPAGMYAQDTTTFTLDDCIKYALENTTETQNARIDEQIAQAKVKETRGIGLPQIEGSIAVQHNQKLPRFFATKGVAAGFSGIEKGTPEYDDFLPGVADDDVVASQNFFQLKSGGNAGISINQILFNSSYLVGLKAASTYKELAYKSSEQTKIQVVENVTKSYYLVLINSERIGLFDANIARVDSLLRSTKALYQNGFAESIDVDRIQVTLNNLRIERSKFLKLKEVSLSLLKYQMNYPLENTLTVVGSIESIMVDSNYANQDKESWNYQNRIEYKMLEVQRDLQKLDIKNRYSTGLPSLVAFANLGYSTQSPNIGGIFKTNTNLSDNGTIGPDKWYSTSTFGISLNIPIFSGLQRTYQIQQAKLSLLKIENSFTSLKRAIDLDVQQNSTIYSNALETLGSQKQNMELAERVARVTKIKYEQGVGSNIEVTEAESALREAQVNYYDALYEAMVAKIDLDKAYGKINPSIYADAK